MRELKALRRAPGVDVSLPNESDLYVWRVELIFDTDTSLGTELTANDPSAPVVQLEVHFSPQYPVAPPFVRVISPRFEFHTGHVTIGAVKHRAFHHHK